MTLPAISSSMSSVRPSDDGTSVPPEGVISQQLEHVQNSSSVLIAPEPRLSQESDPFSADVEKLLSRFDLTANIEQKKDIKALLSWLNHVHHKLSPHKKSPALPEYRINLPSATRVILSILNIEPSIKNADMRNNLPHNLFKIYTKLPLLWNGPVFNAKTPFDKLPTLVQDWMLRTGDTAEIPWHQLSNFSQRDLRAAQFSSSKDINYTFDQSNLSGCLFASFNVRVASFINAKIQHAEFRDSNLPNAKLTKADLSHTRLENIDLEQADCSGAIFHSARLDNVNFTKADLSHAKLTNIDLIDVNFNNAKLEGTQMSITLDLSSELNIDSRINHLNNRRGVLTSINSIPNEYTTLRTTAMATIIEQLNELSDEKLQGSWASLADILLSHPVYAEDARIAKFIDERLLRHWMANINQALFHSDGVDISFVLERLNQVFTQNWASPEYQGAVNQILYAATQPPVEEKQKHLAHQLRQRLLTNPNIQAALPAIEAIETGLAHETYLFSAEDGLRVVALESEQFQDLVSLKSPQVSLQHLYQFERHSATSAFDNVTPTDLSQTYAVSPFLQARHLSIIGGQVARQLVSTVLGDSAHALRFVEALQCQRVSEKLLSAEQQWELRDHFSALWVEVKENDGDVYLQPAHQNSLWQAANTLGLTDTPTNRACLLLVLAAVFTRYSSSALFGSETDSPQALRIYASALLNEACKLDATLIESSTLTNWQARLMGKEFACTAILSNMMKTGIQELAKSNSNLEQLFLNLYPAAWR
ncbi:pentapeptide repeat-containing protein [Pseudomonas vancouverensis]|uniref:pentapeptide repeat-containing protein n=1 Tax=Pseudomonas vancouverensis TaxID=95300 RepID=UPI003D08E7E4